MFPEQSVLGKKKDKETTERVQSKKQQSWGHASPT